MIIYCIHNEGPFILGPETPDHTGVKIQCLFILRHGKPDHTGAKEKEMGLAASAAIVKDTTDRCCIVMSSQAHVYCLMFLCSVLSWFQDKTVKTRIKHSQRNKQFKIIHGNIPSWFCHKCGNQCLSSTPIYKAAQLKHLPKPIP